jgi:two-component system sensor histidine kinase/response regulator
MVSDLDRQGGKLSVLLAEDNELNQKVMLAFLQLLDCDTTAVVDGLEAFDAIAAGDFDVALIDIQLPGQNGLELVIRLRTELEGGAPMLVAVTAMARSDGTDYYGALGFDAYLGKPVALKDLGELLAGIDS